MTYRPYRKPARPAARRTRSTVLVASVIAGIALIGLTTSPSDSLHGDPEPAVIGNESHQPNQPDQPTAVTGSDSTQASTTDRGQAGEPGPTVSASDVDQPPIEAPGQRDDPDRHDRRAPAMQLGEADGVVLDGVTVTV